MMLIRESQAQWEKDRKRCIEGGDIIMIPKTRDRSKQQDALARQVDVLMTRIAWLKNIKAAGREGKDGDTIEKFKMMAASQENELRATMKSGSTRVRSSSSCGIPGRVSGMILVLPGSVLCQTGC